MVQFWRRAARSLKIKGIDKGIDLYDFDAKISWKQGRSLEEILKNTTIHLNLLC